MVRSSVSMLLVTQENPSIVLIRRPIKKGDPWSGDICLPGGRKAKDDKHSFATAVRETREEVSLDLSSQGSYLGRLSDVLTRAHERTRPMLVTPYVFAIDSAATLKLSHEAREIMVVPLAFLGNPKNRQTMHWQKGLISLRLPCYRYKGARIWGLTLSMLDELIRLTGGKIPKADNWFRLVGLRG